MAKKVKYNLGDIFKLPITNDLFGFGRILIIQSPALFVGFYDLVSPNIIDIDTLKENEPFLKIMCGDLGFKKNEWFIIGNIPLNEKIEVPFFWGKDALTDKLYIRKYKITQENPLGLGLGFEDKPTTEKEIKEKEAQPDGLNGWKAAEIVLKMELERKGII
jgi:hypothetical protein